MKKSFKSRILSAVLTCTMLLTTPIGTVKAAAEDTGKYISEVYIAYGSTEDEAKNWLTSHGWEPVEGNFNAGKDDSVAAVMGIKRTSDPNDAVTDMAVMNMGTEGHTGYSFDDYKGLIKEKQADINEFIDSFLPVIYEYRDNYKGKGSAAGQARAQLAHDLLNKYYDGEIDGQYAVNDTGMPLGDLFLNTTRRELGEAKYDALSKNEQVKYGDLQQIILESTGVTLLSVEKALALAADPNEDSWLDRLEDMSYLDMKTMAELYADGNSSLSDSAAQSLLMSKYGDAAESLAKEYDGIQQELIWYRSYIEANQLVKAEDENDEAYQARIEAFFENRKAIQSEENYELEMIRFDKAGQLYAIAYATAFAGDWGDTLGEFLVPEDLSEPYSNDPANFLPLAVSLSDGQRAGLKFLSLESLLLLGGNDIDAAKETMPELQELGDDVAATSVYSGMNRAIFREGVALTNRAMMEKAIGKSPYEETWGFGDWGWVDVLSASLLAESVIFLYAGRYVLKHAAESLTSELQATLISTTIKPNFEGGYSLYKNALNELQMAGANDPVAIKSLNKALNVMSKNETASMQKYYDNALYSYDQTALLGKWLLGIGGAMMIAAAVLEGVHLWKYFNRDFIPIPLYIVDEADIVSYTKDKNGNEVKNINFNQYVYYEVVKCNRQDIGVNEHAQDGVDQYAEWGCGDAADLNCDVGKQWLALYTVKSSAKGNPILANSLKLQTGSNDVPSGCTAPLHFFTYTHAANLGDEAYAYDNDKNGVYFFWDTDANAFTATAFTGGQLALAGVGGLAVGILGATVVTMMTRKRKETPEAPAVA